MYLLWLCPLAAKSAIQAGRLLGEVQLSGRYNIETYEPRVALERDINHFLVSHQTGLLIVGEAGVGKTNVLTHLCQRLLNDRQVVLFYTGLDFKDNVNVEQRLLEDCGCMHRIPSLGELLETLDSLRQTPGRLTHFVVLVDSVESAGEPAHLLRMLDGVISKVPYLWFKVIVTVQTGAYKAIADEHDKIRWRPITPTKYYVPDDKTKTTAAPMPDVILEPFNLTELKGAWNKEALSINLTSLSKATRNLIRHPYFFRLFVDLYKKPSTDASALLAVSTTWELSQRYYETNVPALIGEGGRHRNPARVLLNELISKLLEERFIWFSILALAEDPTIAPYFADYDANRPYADLLTFGILREHATSDRTDVIVSFTPKQLFAYALYEYFRSSTDFSIDNIVAIVADLLCYPTTQIVVTDGVTFDEQHEAIRYYKVLYNFWNPPLVEAIAHLLADRVEAGEEEMFVIPFLVHCYGTTGGYYAAEHISIKLIEVIARTKPETLGRLIPTMISVCPMPIVAISEDRILGQLFNDLVGNVLTQEAISIAGALVAEWANRPAEIVGVYLMLARVYQAAHNDEQRRANLLEANRHAIASGDVVKKGQVANAIGVFYNETGGDPATAIEWLEQGLECAIKAGQSQDSIAAAHFNIGVALANQREFVRAVSHLEQSLKLMDVKDTPLFVAKIQAEIGKAQEAQGNFEQAMTAYQLAVSLYGAAGDAEQTIDLTFRIGGTLMKTRQFSQAADVFRKSLEVWDKTVVFSPEQHFASMSNLALALAGVEGNAAEAAAWFRKAKEYHDDTGLSRTEDYFIAQLNSARFLSHIAEYAEAITIYATALKELSPNIEEVVGRTLSVELGALYVKRGEYQLGVKHLLDGLPFFEATKQERALADLYEILGNAYREQGLSAQAAEYYRRSYPLLVKCGMSELAAKVKTYMD